MSRLHTAHAHKRAAEDARWIARHRRPVVGKWHWVRQGVYGATERVPPWAESLWTAADRESGSRPRYGPARVLEDLGDRWIVGWAGAGTTEIVGHERINRRLSPEEMSDHLRREPVRRVWPDPSGGEAGC